jgi:hypothetical protein
MSETHELLKARFEELGRELDKLDVDSDEDRVKCMEIIDEMNEVIRANDALREAEEAEKFEALTLEEMTAEILRHDPVIGPYFNLRCKCGHIGTTVSEKDDFKKHLATSLVEAGWKKK